MPKAFSDLVLSGPLPENLLDRKWDGWVTLLEREVWLFWQPALPAHTCRTLGRGGATSAGRGGRLPPPHLLQPGTSLAPLGKSATPGLECA